jgi:hypothetical protein
MIDKTITDRMDPIIDNKLSFKPSVTFEAPRDFGPIAPVSRAHNDESASFGDTVSAFLLDTPPARVGIQSAYYIDKFIQAQQPDYKHEGADPGFNPFDAWKADGANPDNLDDYISMEGEDDLSWYREKENYKAERRDIIDGYGLTGAVGNFALNVATDPTIYFGFGAGKMLSNGMSSAKAYALSGAAAGTTYEALNAYADPEDASVLKSGGVVAASAIMGGLLGKAVDSFSFVTKKSGGNKTFGEFSLGALANQMEFEAAGGVNGVLNSTAMASSLSAMAARKHDYRLGGNAASQIVGKILKPLVPKLRGQTSQYTETAEFYGKIFGTSGPTKSNFLGEMTPASVSEEMETIKGEFMGMTRDTFNKIKDAERKGIQFTERDYKAGLLLANTKSNLDNPKLTKDYGEAAIMVAKSHRDYFDKWRKTLELNDTSGFSVRQNYAPALLDVDRISTNPRGFTNVLEKSLKYARHKADESVRLLEAKISTLTARIEGETQTTVITAMRKEIKELADELDSFERLSKMDDDMLAREAEDITNQYIMGSPDALMSTVKTGDLLPNRFKARMMDVKDYIDFLHTDPVKLQTSYANSVSPSYAKQKVLGKTSEDEYIADYVAKMADKLSKAKSQKEMRLLQKEQSQAVADIKTAFSDMSGDFYKEAYGKYGHGIGAALSIAGDTSNFLMLGNQVMAGVSEPFNIMLHHGVMTGGKPMIQAIGRLLSDKSFRGLNKKVAGQFGIGLEVARAQFVGREINNSMVASDVAGGIQAAAHKLSGQFQIYNGAAFWDSTMRTASMVAQTGILSDAMKKLISGRGLDKIQIADLAYLGIDKTNASRILKQIEKYPVKHPDYPDLILTNPQAWDDFEAADMWRNAIRRDNQRTSVQSQMGDVPFFFKTPLGSNMFKFKTWATAASTKIMLQGVQKANGRTAAGATAIVGLGALTDVLINASQGNMDQYFTDSGDVSLAELAWAGVNRSGLAGAIPDLGGSAFMNYAFDIQSGGARFSEYNKFWDAVAFGPSRNIVGDIVKSAPLPEKNSDGSHRLPYTNKDGSLRQSSINSMIDLLPLPLVKPYIKHGLDETVFKGK